MSCPVTGESDITSSTPEWSKNCPFLGQCRQGRGCSGFISQRLYDNTSVKRLGRQEMRSINLAIALMALISSAHAGEQKATVQTDTAPIENPPLPRPKPSLLDATGDNPAVPISAFRHQHGEDSVVISAALTRIAQEQANAMAMRDSLDHNALAPFSTRIGRSGFNRAAENIAYGHADFASTLEQWTNSAGHRANLLLHGAKWIGVAHAQNGHRIYWAMVIGAK
jgi:uncharacterized protein YkwD